MHPTDITPAIRKLECGAVLSAADLRVLADLLADQRELGARQDIIREGDDPREVHVVLGGFACRYKLLPDGARQIIGWMLPGDFCHLHGPILGEMDHGMATLSACRMAYVPHALIEAATRESAALTRAFWWSTLVDEAVLREWIVGMGRRSADKQVAHLLCEVLLRLRCVGLETGGTFDWPITQEELADTVGLSAVHVNRVLQHLRHDGLIAQTGRALTVLDEARLREFADFNPNYLHHRERRV